MNGREYNHAIYGGVSLIVFSKDYHSIFTSVAKSMA